MMAIKPYINRSSLKFLPITRIAGLNIPKAESEILKIFKELTTQFGFQQDEISYQNPREDSFCLKKESDGKWVLFYYERGHRHNQIMLSSALEGCFEILDRTIINQDALEAIKSVFTTVILLEKKELGIRLPDYITKYIVKHGMKGYKNIKILYRNNLVAYHDIIKKNRKRAISRRRAFSIRSRAKIKK